MDKIIMVRKFFPVFLLVLLIIIIFSYFQRNNPSIKKILDSKSEKKIESNTAISTPTSSVQKISNVSEKIFLQVDEPKNNITVNNPIINISGKTIPNAFIFINEQELKADANGNFTSATTLEEGENYILIVASDDLGNSIEKDILVNLETTQ
ncbi:MAG: hypothetical protein WCT22_06105 [Patescibacteria group bacterium]